MGGQIHFFLICVYFSASVKCTLPGSVLQQRFIKSNFLPTSSCVEVANQTESSLICSAICLKTHKDNVVSSRHVVSTRCVCCRRLLTGTQFSDTEWTTYQQDGANVVYSYNCPVEYTDVNFSIVRTCLRLELMAKNYSDAALGCQRDGGDLIRIDSAEKYTIFRQFIASNASLTVDDVWIQSFKDAHNVWRFHDSTVMPMHCHMTVYYSFYGYTFENRIGFRVKENFCYGRKPDNTYYSSVCEI